MLLNIKFIMFLLIILTPVIVQAQVSCRRPVLPVGSSMERNSSQAGKLLIGTSYEFEYLEKGFNGTKPAPNPSDERTTSSIFSLFISYSVNDNLTVEGVLPWRNIINAKNNIDPTRAAVTLLKIFLTKYFEIKPMNIIFSGIN